MIGHLDFNSAKHELPLHVIPDIEMLFSEAGCLGGTNDCECIKSPGGDLPGTAAIRINVDKAPRRRKYRERGGGTSARAETKFLGFG